MLFGWRRSSGERRRDRIILRELRRLMVDFTALNAAVAANTQAVTDVGTRVAALEATLGSSAAQTAIDAATGQVSANNVALAAIVPAPVTPPLS